MIIDADTHITPTGEGILVDELLRTMESANVDKAITWLQPPYLRHIDELNAYVYKAMRRYPEKILGFGWADPNIGVAKAKDSVKRCIYEYGLFGIKMNGAQNNFFIDDPLKSIPVIEEIAKTGKPLVFHVGADAYEQTHPFRVAKISKMYPEVPILMVHMGGASIPDLGDAAIEFAQDCPNIHLIGSAIGYKKILKAIKILGASRVSFGSDTPFGLMHVEVAIYNALLEKEISEEDRYNIMGGNILRILNIQSK